MFSFLQRGGLAAVLVTTALMLVHSSPVSAQTLDTLPGGIVRLDDYRAPDGYYAFWPASTRSASSGQAPAEVYSRDSLGLTVFSHGYACLNPVTYGAWLRHLVLDQRQVVIYPRYQRNWVMPGSKAFAKTHNAGLRAAHAALDTLGLPLSHDGPVYVGHSYGAVLTAFLLANEDSLGYRPAFGAVLAAPGTNRLKGSRLSSYGAIDPATQVVIVAEEDDYVVGHEFSDLLYATAPDSGRFALLRHAGAAHGDEALSAGHSEVYGHDEDFDTGRHRLKAAHTRSMSHVDAVDTELFWPLVDEMIAARRERRLHRVFRTTTEGFGFGTWSDGSPRPTLATKLRASAPPLPGIERFQHDVVLDLLSEPHDHVPPPKDVQIPYTLEEMLRHMSVPATPLAPAEAESPVPR